MQSNVSYIKVGNQHEDLLFHFHKMILHFFCSYCVPSLDNMSDDVRWSLDLRWQRADQPVGFYGLKQGVLMRSSAGPVDIDWSGFNAVDRHEKQATYVRAVGREQGWRNRGGGRLGHDQN